MRLPFRRVLFWSHLLCGVTAGSVVLIMCVTGVALTYQRQMQYWADTRDYRAMPAPGAVRAPAAALIAAAQAVDPGATPTTIAYRADPALPVAVALGTRTFYLNPYTAVVYGEGRGQGMRQFFSTMTSWHRYLGRAGEGRATGRMFTGASNLLFLFIVLSGMYLWWPKALTWAQIRNVTWFRRGLRPKARDFNWHNTIGFWSAVPLAVVVASGVVISYPWASNMVYRVMGEEPPAPAAGRAGGPGAPGGAGGPGGSGREGAAREGGARVVGAGVDLEMVVSRAMEQTPGWTILTARVPTSHRAPVSLTIDRGDGGQPQARATASANPASGAIEQREDFSTQTPGRRLRSILRFAHTGEVLGLAGQTIAGVVSLGGAFLVYTGLALSVRRLVAWRIRQITSRTAAASQSTAA